MAHDDSLATSASLLGRLRRNPKDQVAWSEFVARYRPLVLEWCRRWRLQDSDAEDVTQAVLLKLNRLMETFVYDPSGSFRAWLKTLAHHAWRDLVSDRARISVGGGDSRLGELFDNLQAGDDLVEQLDQEFRRGLVD